MVKKLRKQKLKTKGRSKGKITVRHRGGGHKRKYRLMDFKRVKFDIPAKILSIEYDPNRSADIALVEYEDGQKFYILAAAGMKKGQEIISAEKAALKIGNRMRLKNIPIGTAVYNVEMIPGKGGQIARSAGSSVYVMAHEGKYTHLKMPSGEIRIVQEDCLASIGQVSRPEHGLRKLRKAGQKRWLGIRPTVRGSAMTPRDHPHGGGEGRAPIGLKHPKTPWGKPALGYRTRKKHKKSDKFIIKRRK